MKQYSALVLVLLFTMFPSQVIASDTIEKAFCVQAIGYESLDDLKTDLLMNAKRLAVNELFGELIASSTAVENFVVTQDQILASSIGYVRVKDPINYKNGDNFAEACVTIQAYVTEQDREKFTPIQLNKRHCIANAELTTQELTTLAKEEAILQTLLDYNRRLEEIDKSKLLRLMQRVSYSESGFLANTETYCTQVSGYITPIEIVALLETSSAIDDLESSSEEPTTKPSSVTILEPNQVWRQGDYEVTMTNPQLWSDGNGFSFEFNLTSKKSKQVTVEYSLASVSAVDNLGNQLEVNIRDRRAELASNSQCRPFRVVIQPQRESRMYCSLGGDIVTDDFYVQIDTANSELTEVIVSLTGTLGIDKAQWRITIPH